MTQEELAEKIGVSQPMVFKYENADYQGRKIIFPKTHNKT